MTAGACARICINERIVRAYSSVLIRITIDRCEATRSTESISPCNMSMRFAGISRIRSLAPTSITAKRVSLRFEIASEFQNSLSREARHSLALNNSTLIFKEAIVSRVCTFDKDIGNFENTFPIVVACVSTGVLLA